MPRKTLVTGLSSLPILALAACGENSTPAATIGSAETVVSLAEGRSLYQVHCSLCHQPQGEGVQGSQPPLAGNSVVTGNVGRLVEITVLGVGDHAGGLEPTGQWRQQMQSFEFLSDAEVAGILTYIRNSWGNNAGAVSEEQVWEARQDL